MNAARVLRDELAANPPASATTCAPKTYALNETIDLVAIDIERCDNTGDTATYTRFTILTIDFGGNDTYLNNAGGNRLIELGGCNEFRPDPLEMRPAAAAALLDFGGTTSAGPPFVERTAGASLGAALLVDIGGNDTYSTRGAETAANTNGNKPDGAGVNGGGHIGVGMLIDDEGKRPYGQRLLWHQWRLAIRPGALVDGNGSVDDYNASFGGVNGGANGGAAFLYDGGGSDRYNGEGRVANGGACMALASSWTATATTRTSRRT